MSANIVLDLARSFEEAERRLSSSTRRASPSRLDPRVLRALREHLSGQERPSITAVRRSLSKLCRRWKLPPPSRATIYHLIEREPLHTYDIGALPKAARDALYNVAPTGRIAGGQLAFYCFNYGTLAALSFAAGLPWIDLEQAGQIPGWRGRSRGLLDAVLRERA